MNMESFSPLGCMEKINNETPSKLQVLKSNRLKDHLLLEVELLKDLHNLIKEKPTDMDIDLEIIDEIRGSTPFRVANFKERLNELTAIVEFNGAFITMPIHTFVNEEMLKPGARVLISKGLAIVGCLDMKAEEAAIQEQTLMVNAPEDTFEDIGGLEQQIQELKESVFAAPEDTFEDIGGLEQQLQELKESVEWPFTKIEEFERMGIDPPRGVLLFGKPGCGKTLMARAVARAANASFFRLSASSLIQKYLGEGPEMVRTIFKLAAKRAPSIIFIDEIDAIGQKRTQSTSSGESEVQRTMIELLARLDGFDAREKVCVIFATNRLHSLDPALIRPGRIDRLIEVPVPTKESLVKIFQVHTKNMSLAQNVDVTRLFADHDGMTGADIKALCSDAGLTALRKFGIEKQSGVGSIEVAMEDFEEAKNILRKRLLTVVEEGMFL